MPFVGMPLVQTLQELLSILKNPQLSVHISEPLLAWILPPRYQIAAFYRWTTLTVTNCKFLSFRRTFGTWKMPKCVDNVDLSAFKSFVFNNKRLNASCKGLNQHFFTAWRLFSWNILILFLFPHPDWSKKPKLLLIFTDLDFQIHNSAKLLVRILLSRAEMTALYLRRTS